MTRRRCPAGAGLAAEPGVGCELWTDTPPPLVDVGPCSGAHAIEPRTAAVSRIAFLISSSAEQADGDAVVGDQRAPAILVEDVDARLATGRFVRSPHHQAA